MVKSNNNKKSLDKLILILATGLGTGYSPKVPGTFGSILAILVYLIIDKEVFILYTIVLIISSFYIGNKAEKIFKEKDCQKITIDELVGMSIPLLFIPNNTIYILLALILFRFFDILKIYPANKIEKINGSIGLIGDDIVAGIYTTIVIQIIITIL